MHSQANGNGHTPNRVSDSFDFPEVHSMPQRAAAVAAEPEVDGKTYLLGRGIPEDIIEKFTISSMYRFNGRSQSAVGFPYRYGDSQAIKWRSAGGQKRFSQENVCEDFFLLETHKPGNSILICEGEMDALAWKAAGLPDNVTVVSVPNGAPARVGNGKVSPSEDNKFRYVWRAKHQLGGAPRVYLSTDNDAPGKALREELARRIGKSKSWIVDLGSHKDAAEALQKEGAAFLVERFNAAEPLPVLGLHVAEDFDAPYASLYEHGQMRGAEVGIHGVDELISVPLGMVTVMTGFPGSGKSDLLDQFCCNLARDHGWKTVFCSFEKPPTYHIAQLSQKLTGKAFFDDPANAEDGVQRMTEEERDFGLKFCQEHFMFMDASNGGPSDIDGILDTASAAVMRMGCRILVIDPYNYLTVDRSGLETDAISDILTKVRLWAISHDAHVFFVAHPAKPDVRAGKYVCGGNDISKSAAWFSKADIGLTAWRGPTNESELHVWKVRWSWMGTTGFCKLKHTRANSRWSDGHGFAASTQAWDLDGVPDWST